ncbi:hypothetical protein [Nostoc commune]|uniref:hypothetical protein n=1 Tax=Nostoc commune TaxID=1178 RepID=UPI0018C67F07|nr:hypothetical protein [Nostoc commune]MBG1264814.1 hypothetical protein [Nostoc commune BAE]
MKLKVFLICTGLGQVMRGYESFAEQAFQTLSKEPSLDIILFKGLPCIIHDYGVTRYIFDDKGYFGNFKQKGSLTDLISQVLSKNGDKSKFYQRHRFIYERFSWDKLL